MTREEKINDASETYMNGLFEDGVEIPNEDYENIFDAFCQGAEWADEHPNNVWHDANEKPHAKKWLLVQLDKDDYKILCLKDLYIDLWCDWCKIFNFIRWAYIDNLLSKGGKK